MATIEAGAKGTNAAGGWLARLIRRGKSLVGIRDRADRAAEELYGRAVARARAPVFYTSMGVPDSHDGRLELVQLHVILLLRRLQRGGADMQAIGQALFDAMFRDLDRSLREGGVGDLSVGGWVKKIAQQFYARATAVEAALEGQDQARLEAMLGVNVLGGAGPERARLLASYLLAEDAALAAVAPAGSPLDALRFRPIEAIHMGSVEPASTPAAG